MRRDGRAPTNRRAWALAALLVLVACDAPKPTPEPTLAGLPTDMPATSVASPQASQSPEPADPSAIDLISRAVNAGDIDVATAYLYRAYALWGDPRLPEAYRGDRAEDLAIGLMAIEADAFTPEQQAIVRPFVVRPTHADSYWTADPQSQPEAARSGRGVRFARLADDPRCTDGLWARRELVNIPVTIWGRCRLVSGSTQLGIEDAMSRAARITIQVWDDMLGDMGPPIPDRWPRSTPGPNDVPEGNDGRLDIYLVEAPNVSYGRSLDVQKSGAAAWSTQPYSVASGTSAAYIVMDVAKVRSAFDQEATMVHEIFHVLQAAHNVLGTQACPYPDTAITCPASDRSYHWFVEASAQWAVHEYLPSHRSYVYESFQEFRSSAMSLMSTDGENEYASFMWPLFMEQETPRGAGVVVDAWTALEGKAGWQQVQSALDGVLGFEEHFRDFAVRVWNENLNPGDPINPRFRHPNLDPAFPESTPEQDPDPRRFLGDEILALDRPVSFTVDLAELWAGYYRIGLPPGAHRLTLNFAGLSPPDKLDVDALVSIRDADWERRELDPVLTEWCLDKPTDAVEDVILVLSNHSQTPGEHITGTWTVEAETAGCATATDALTYTSMRKVGNPGDSYYETIFETASVQVRLKASPDGFGFVDDGSTFRGGVDTTSFIAGLPGANCDTIAEGHGGGGGPIASTDGAISGFYANGVLTVTFSLPITVTSSGQNCLGSSSGETVHWITPPPCDGTEIVGQDLVFDFNCTFQGPDWQWTFSGRVKIAA